jgi:hypothetical protein
MVAVVVVGVLRRVCVFVVKERGRCCVREVRWWGVRWGTDFCTEGIKENNTNGRTTQTMRLHWFREKSHILGCLINYRYYDSTVLIGLPPSIAPAHTTANPGIASGTFMSDEP